MQQAIEHPLFLTLGEKGRIAHFHCHLRADLVEKARELGQPRRPELGRQLQPVRRYTLAQRGHQTGEIERRFQLITQVALVADIPGKLGSEAKVRRHDLCPAREGARGRTGVESGVALDGIEHLAVVAKHLVAGGIGGIQVVAPGVFAPGRTTKEIRQG